MNRILVDAARARGAEKRGFGHTKVDIDDAPVASHKRMHGFSR